ncbi:Cytochrome P450 [Glarea lozoyensis ATCC 20868]|uniref:Cytochrome P450 n=1 Tax=Glarea lozoyensis (strain ATCC 20868 / MF5171) TaxID=1116229 RepID=S3D1M5_GLAL2|nr:Cytochrome P450 [Glarea lozoyensis ATCC 20868]EPE31715.1 Cytochrome P450 [Glarea lozoyensis ATCC 20868]
MVSRISGAVFLGHPHCRDEQWLRLSVDYSINVFQTSFTLKLFPSAFHPLISRLIPAQRRLSRNLKDAETIIGPIADEIRKKNAGQTADVEREIPGSLLSWMVHNSDFKVTDNGTLAATQLILTLASVHTTSMAVCNALFDICAHPGTLRPLLDEIMQVLDGKDPEQLCTQDLSQMKKLDSFLLESQRFNPPILLSPQRVTMEPITLKDGTFLPKGTQVAWPAANILMDPNVTFDPEAFNPWRSFEQGNETSPASTNAYGHTSEKNLLFGHGRQACPGRFFAVAEIKMILARMLIEYDFRFCNQGCRPKSLTIDEMVFPNPFAKLSIKRRNEGR